MRGLRSRRYRFLALFATTVMIATACSSGNGTDEDPDGGSGGTTTPGDDGTGGDMGAGSDAAFTYNTGIFEDTTTDNVSTANWVSDSSASGRTPPSHGTANAVFGDVGLQSPAAVAPGTVTAAPRPSPTRSAMMWSAARSP